MRTIGKLDLWCCSSVKIPKKVAFRTNIMQRSELFGLLETFWISHSTTETINSLKYNFCYNSSIQSRSTGLRERSFLILGTGAEDFSQGYETFLYYFVG